MANIKKVRTLAAALAALALTACGGREQSIKRLNSRAAEEYLEPVRPFTEGRNPCWNSYADKFIYAPVFDFTEVAGAAEYEYTVSWNGGSASFRAGSPDEALSPVWNDIPVGQVQLCVKGYDAAGREIGTAGERSFMRDYPFSGPYPENARPYGEAARLGLMYIHRMPQVRYWEEHCEPDMSYKHNTYADKIIGRTISAESMVAELFPSLREEALKAARNAAAFLMAQARPEGEMLEGFPPTYYGGLIASARSENEGKMITTDACMAANGYLDLFDVCADSVYFNEALKIARTYVRIQDGDGSIPIKCVCSTGEPVNGAKAMLHPMLNFFRRLEEDYGRSEFRDARLLGEKWMREVAVKSFDMTGQFEDVSVEDVKPYANLTNCTAAPFASYLLRSEKVGDEALRDAVDLIRLSEDQFVHWDWPADENGIKRIFCPCVFEQYRYKTPVDNSSCNVANAWLDLYELTGDELAFAKAKALADALTIAQEVTSGRIPTTFDLRKPAQEPHRTWWINCSVSSIRLLLRMEKYDRN